jgi:hypothetical protein
MRLHLRRAMVDLGELAQRFSAYFASDTAGDAR